MQLYNKINSTYILATFLYLYIAIEQLEDISKFYSLEPNETVGQIEQSLFCLQLLVSLAKNELNLLATFALINIKAYLSNHFD